MELLARLEAGEHQIDRLFAFSTKSSRDVEDLNGLAHVEDEGLAVAPDGGRLDDQLHRFWTVMK